MIKVLLKNGSLYVFLDLMNKGIPFFLLPILTRYLSQAEYGRIANFTALVSLLAILCGVNVQGVVRVNYFKLSNENFKLCVTNSILLLAASSVLIFLVMFFVHYLLSNLLGLDSVWMFVAVFVAVSQFITTVNLTLWQVEGKPKKFGIYEILNTSINAIISILLIVYFDMAEEGRLLAISFTGIVFGLISLFIIFRRNIIVNQVHLPSIVDAIKFGVPLIPHVLSGWLKLGIDRLYITSILGVTATGTYFVGYQIGMIVGIIAAAFQRAYLPFLYSRLTDITKSDKILLVKITYVYFFFILSFAFFLGIVSYSNMQFIVGNDFLESGKIVIWVALGYAFDGMYLMVVNYVFFLKKTYWLSVISVVGSLLHCLLSYILILENGIIGAAQATFISFVFSFFCVWWLSSRLYSMPWLTCFSTK